MKFLIDFLIMVMRVFSIVGLFSVFLFYLLFDFMHRSDDHDDDGTFSHTAIVFTGAYDRIDLGLELLSSGDVDRLLITGANRTSGLIPARFPDLFDPGSQQAGWVASGKIVLAPDAHSTFENALEEACWLDTQPDVEAVTLITSRRHMARASIALQRGIAAVSIVRMVSDPAAKYDRLEIDLEEFGRFVATWGITLLPRAFWPANEPEICLSR